MVRELGVGIYVFDSVPCFGLDFNPDSDMYSVIHPFYRNTFVGRVMGLLDYYMKGFLNGGFFNEEFIKEWQKSPTHDKQFLKDHCIDMYEYCQTHLGSDARYMSIWEVLEILEQQEKTSGDQQSRPSESPVLSDYQGFRSSFRIHAEQNSINKWENLFRLDGGFRVSYTVLPDPVYAEELRKFRSEHGCDPAGYTRLLKAYEIMKAQIETLMTRLPLFKDLFERLKVINFFSYYFKNLKLAQKVPVFASKSINRAYACPPKFPHLPIRKILKQNLSLDLGQVFKQLTQKERQAVELYIKTATDFSDLPAYVLEAIGPSFTKCLKEKAAQQLSDGEAASSKHKKTILDFMKILAETSQNLTKEALSTKEVLLKKQQSLQDDIQSGTVLRDTQKLENQKSQNNLNEYKKAETDLIANKATLEANRAKYTPESVNKVLAEFNTDLAEVQKILGDLTKNQIEMELHLKKIEDNVVQSEEDLKQVSSLIIEIDKTSQNSLDITANATHVPFYFSKPTIQLMTELSEEEKFLTKRCVGGCVMTMEAVPLVSDPATAQIITTSFSQNLQTLAEEWMAFKDSQDGQPSGYVFRLNVADFPATGGKDYDWMQFSSVQDSPDTAIHKAATFTALHEGNFQMFQKQIQRGDCLRAKDPNGFYLIHYAASHPSAQYLKEILKLGVKGDMRGASGYTPLHCAATVGNIENLKLLLEHVPGTINLRADNGETPLNLAVQYNHLEAVKFLIQKGASVNNRMAHGMTPLYSAIHNELREIALFLLDVGGVDVNCPLEDGTTMIYLATETEQLEILSKLITKGGDINRARIDSYTPLHIAAKNGSKQVLQVLFQHASINIDCQLKSGKTALHLAAEYNHPSIVLLLLQKGANPLLYGWDEETPLFTAVAHGNGAAVSHLLKYDKEGKLVNKSNVRGKNPITEAIKGRFYEIIDTLLKHKPSLTNPSEFLFQLCQAKIDPQFISSWISLNNLKDEDLQKAYYISAQAGHNQMVSMFQRVYKVKDYCDNDGWTSAHFAAKYDHLNVIQDFLKTAKDLKMKDKSGKTLAAIAAEHGSHRVLKLLLKAMKNDSFENHYQGAHLLMAAIKASEQECADLIIHYFKHPNFPLDSLKRIATHIAAINGDVEMLDFLRTRGARFDIRDKDKKTAFHYAFEWRRKDAIAYLLNKKYELTFPPDLLAFVSAHGTKEHILTLIGRGFGLNNCGQEEPPIFEAIRQGRRENILVLLENGADLELIFDGDTPLLFAAKEGKADIATALLVKGAKHSKDPKGNNALHLAVKMGHEACVATLINGGINPLEKNQQGLTPTDVAKQEGFSHLIFYLRGKEAELERTKSSIIVSLESGDEQRFFQLIKDFPLNEPILFEVEGKKEALPLLYLIHLKSRSPAILKRFLNLSGVKHSVQAPERGTVYHLMAAKGEKIDFNQIDPCTQDKRGVSILHLLACHEKSECLKAALPHVKNVDIEDKQGQTALDYAIQAKNQTNVSLLLQKGADPNHQTHKKSGPLTFAIKKEFSLICRLLLQHGAKVNQCFFENRRTPLHLAAEKKFTDIVKLLIEHGADVNKEDLFGVRPIHLAACFGNMLLVRMLHAAGASLNVKDHDGKSVAHWAAQSKERGPLDYLKEVGVALNKQTKIVKPSLREAHFQRVGLSTLDLAAENGNIENVQALIENGCDPKMCVEDGLGPLFYATKSGKVEVLKLFIKMGVMEDTEQKALAIQAAIVRDAVNQLHFFYTPSTPVDLCLDKMGTTGLHIAAKKDAKRCLHYFITKGGDPQKPTLHGETAFEIAVKTNRLAIAFYLVKHAHIDLKRKLKEEKTYLHLACEAGNCEVAAWLIENKLSLEDTDQKGWTPLHYGVKQGNYGLIHLLLACGANPDTQTAQKLSPFDLLPANALALKNLLKTYQEARKLRQEAGESRLHTAIRLNDVQHFPLLFKLTDKNHQNKAGETPLHLAVFHQDSYFFRILVQNGADLELRNYQGLTPLGLLVTTGNDRFYAKTLIELGANVCVTDIQERTMLHAITFREDKIFSEKFFNLIYKTIPKRKLEQFSVDDVNHAIKSKNIKNFFYLIDEGFPLKKKLNSFLQEAVTHGADELAVCLLNWFKVSYEKKLIEMSYRFNQKGVTQALCQYGRKNPAMDEKSLQLLIQNDNLSAFLDFSQYKIDFNQIAADNQNTLLHTAAKSNSRSIAEFLIWFGIDPNARNKLENTPLHLAANFNNSSLVELLLNKGANPHLINNNGWTPLSLSLQNSLNSELVQYFKNKNADINFTCNGYSQSQRAAHFNKPMVLKHLLMLGVRFLPFELKEKDKSEISLIVQKMHMDALKVICDFACERQDQKLLLDLKRLYSHVIDKQSTISANNKDVILTVLGNYPIVTGDSKEDILKKMKNEDPPLKGGDCLNPNMEGVSNPLHNAELKDPGLKAGVSPNLMKNT